MIQLTRLNGNPLYVNCDLVKWAEAAPDTMLTLINGEKVVVSEPCAEVVARMSSERVSLLAQLVGALPDADALLRGVSVASIHQASTTAEDPDSESESESG